MGKKKQRRPKPGVEKLGVVVLIKKGVTVGELAPVIRALRESGIVDTVQLFRETTE